MNKDLHLKVHVSIQKGCSLPALQRCNNCCFPAKYHCPFCLPSFFKPTKPSRARIHLTKHLKRAITVGEYTIHKCALGCRNQPHYHCLYCTATLIRTSDFTRHLSFCGKRRAEKLPQLVQTATTQRVETEGMIAPLLTPGRDDIPSFVIKSNDDSSDGSDDSEDIAIILDSDDPNSQGASSSSSSRLATPIVDSSKCDRTVQTNIEKPQDCDEYYFMSLVKLFKKLSPQKKSEVRMKIERLLFEAEFE
ncbi:uncharacterized protein LOC126394594 [Epinephelus moara]|uniref:uncharacterized protein LOC126394594 n=1 Tax=Epinephelus moara TaxID=300413 RepID=UPI00214DF626|nr:uncharacterized protein LOC126394594 [Epinephelus moara]